MRKGILFVLSGPSGAGKGTVLKEVFKELNDLEYSVSATTRKPREDEKEGKNYYFKTDAEFNKMISSGEMLEYVEKYGNRYGTIKSHISKKLNEGKDIILEIETIGAENVRKTDLKQVSIFLTPSSIKELHYRLNIRNTETKRCQDQRLCLGKDEIKCAYNYDYIVINDDLHKAVAQVIAIIKAERCKVKVNINTINKIIEEIEKGE